MVITNKKLVMAAIKTGYSLVSYISVPMNYFSKRSTYDMLIDDLSFMGIVLDLNELKQIHEDYIHESPQISPYRIIERTNLKIYNSIKEYHGLKIADWYQLSFELSKVALITKNSPRKRPSKLVDFISKDELIELGKRVDYPKSDFIHIIESIDTSNPNESLIKFLDKSMELVDSPYIFISHTTADSGIAKEFADMLAKRNIKTFVANLDILSGTNWDKKLKEEIYKSDELLLILSPKSLKSKWVMIEVGAAWILEKHITPAILYANENSIPEPIKKFQAKNILTTSEREKIVDDIALRYVGKKG